MSANKSVQYIPLGELHFDWSNPRFPDRIKEVDDNQVIDWMIRNGDIEALMESIATSDYSDAEPVLTVKRGENGYDVVEGNRRLAAVKLLSHPEMATIKPKSINSIAEGARYRPDSIPALVYDDKQDIIAYLGYRHITGVKSWGPLEKAKYLKQLFLQYQTELGDVEVVFNHISKIIATKPYHAKKTLAVLTLYDLAIENAFWGLELSPEMIDFSVLGTAFNYNNIVKFLELSIAQDWELLGLNEQAGRELFDWLFVEYKEGKTRVGESRNLRTLAYVVSNEQALEAFRNDISLTDSTLYTTEADENFRKFLSVSLKWLREAERQSNRISNPTNTDQDLLNDIEKISHRLKLYLEEQLSGNLSGE